MIVKNILVALIFIAFTSYVASEPSCFDPFCELNNNILVCNNFTNFQQLNFKCQPNLKLYSVFLQPKVKLTVDDKLNFTGLQDLYELVMVGIDKFDLSTNPLKNLPRVVKQIELQNSNVSFINTPKPKEGLFANFRLNILAFTNVQFLSAMPSILFENTTVTTMSFSGSNFDKAFANEGLLADAKTTIQYLAIHNLKVGFDSAFLNKNVFSRTYSIQLDNTAISKIDDDFSQTFPGVKDLIVEMKLNKDQKWLRSLNSGVYVNLDQQTPSASLANQIFYLEMYDKGDYFTESRFCEFADLPHKQLVIPIIDAGAYQITTQRNVSCTCTFYLLYKYHRKLTGFNTYASYATSIDCFKSPNFDKELNACDLQNRQLACKAKCLEPYCHLSGKSLVCDNFTDFSQLDFSCSRFDVYSIILKPQVELTVDNKLNLAGVTDIYELIFENINGFNLAHNPISKVAKSLKQIEIKHSKLNFRNANGASGIFSNLGLNLLIFQNVEFTSGMPAEIFSNSNIDVLEFSNSNFESAFLVNDDEHLSHDIGTVIERVRFNNIKVPFDNKKLNKRVFKHTYELVFDNTAIGNMDKDFAKYFVNLKYITCEMANNPNQNWLPALNKKVNFDLDTYELDESFFDNIFILDMYDSGNYFSDDKICDYKDFPHNQLVLPLVDATQYTWEIKRNVTCTCTIYWLYKYHKHYLDFPGYDIYANTIDCLSEENFDAGLKKCDFDKLFKPCSGNNGNNGNNANRLNGGLIANVIILAISAAIYRII